MRYVAALVVAASLSLRGSSSASNGPGPFRRRRSSPSLASDVVLPGSAPPSVAQASARPRSESRVSGSSAATGDSHLSRSRASPR